MVRFKNRLLLVEFLQPSSLTSNITSTKSSSLAPFDQADTAKQDEEDVDMDDEDVKISQPTLPFLLPLPSVDGSKSMLGLGDDAGSIIFRAIRSSIQEVFGDEGWGRIASSFKVIYHSPLTSLTILRVSRQHYRLLWSGLTMMTTLNSQPILPRVVAVSGTIKKLQNAAIVYHRRVTGMMLNVVLAQEEAVSREDKRKSLETKWDAERQSLSALED